jgi:hypothetical protein
MALRVWPGEAVSAVAAQRRVLDVGCSVGVGTLALVDQDPQSAA